MRGESEAREGRKTTKILSLSCKDEVLQILLSFGRKCWRKKKKNGDKKHRDEVREKVGDGKSNHGSQKNPYDDNSPCENCSGDL